MSDESSKFESKVRAEWMDEATAGAWRRWHDKSVVFWSDFTDALIGVSDLKPGHRVLDLASGTGDPAIAIAGRVGPSGVVTVTDLAPQMIEIARTNAAKAGLSNLSFEVVDAHSMPYAEAQFDRVTCRLGVMFFWDCRRALAEIRRVLKPGGIASFVAWGRLDENEYMMAAMAPFKKRRAPPEAPAGAPTPYRFGEAGSLSGELIAAGFSQVSENTNQVRMKWPGPPEELWTRLYEVSAPMRPYFNSFSPEVRAEAIVESTANLSSYYDGREVSTRVSIVVAAGRR
jgi:ubiquinone/menaquinone biosynthesis C-methylase UbiE